MSESMLRRLFILMCVIGVLLPALPLRGDGIYTYLDPNGKKIFTNVFPKDTKPSAGQETKSPKGSVGNHARLAPSPGALELSTELGTKIEKMAQKYDLARFNLGSEFVRAVIKVESNFNPRAVSPKGARGLMQLMPETARRFGVRDIFDPDQNLDGGVQYLKFLLDTFEGNVNLALAAYNAGENVVQRLKDIPPYRETRDYVQRVSNILGSSKSVPLYDTSRQQLTYVAWVGSKLKFTNVDPPVSAVVFDGYHLPKMSGTP